MSNHFMIARGKEEIFKSKKLFSVSKHPLPPAEEPTCVSKAMQCHEWKQAMFEEFTALMNNAPINAPTTTSLRDTRNTNNGFMRKPPESSSQPHPSTKRCTLMPTRSVDISSAGKPRISHYQPPSPHCTQLQVTDILTKAVTRPRHQFLVSKLMLIDQQHQFEGGCE
ncbi:hypothetical protein KIW84_043587 [Lathyrus oleraceus]|uniref:Uncharacterized protein n=1 Tax=Pisum sativum TaxID=3888 RepID=A0A9D5AUR3_PEA|nr:hypothetical protein KIW84_043587 [Pisum sativum]